MQTKVGIVRSPDDLKEALNQLDVLRARGTKVKVDGNIQFNPGWHLAMDLANMIDISEAVTRAALERTESRGGHTREDFPDSDAAWGKQNLIVTQEGSEIKITHKPLEDMPDDLKQLFKK